MEAKKKVEEDKVPTFNDTSNKSSIDQFPTSSKSKKKKMSGQWWNHKQSLVTDVSQSSSTSASTSTKEKTKRKRGPPTDRELYLREAEKSKAEKRPQMEKYFKPLGNQPIYINESNDNFEEQHETNQILELKIKLSTVETECLEKDRCIEQLYLQVDSLKNDITSITEEKQNKINELEIILFNLKQRESELSIDNIKLKQQIEKITGIHQSCTKPSIIHSLVSSLYDNFEHLSTVKASLLQSLISNIQKSCNKYTTDEQDFWIDMYNNVSHSQFSRISENLNGPWRNTVQRWQGRSSVDVLNLTWENVAGIASEIISADNPLTKHGDELVTNSLCWGNRSNTKEVKLSSPMNCMIDETATKIVTEFNPYDMKLYGLSAMPRFVIIRNVAHDFNVREFFDGLTFQYDRKFKSEIVDTQEINLGKNSYWIAFAQFETYKDWETALSRSTSDIIVEPVKTYPIVDENNPQESVDMHFAEAASMSRPRSTYIYSLAINQATENHPLREAAAISTNNRYLQTQDHILLTYNLIKMFNSCHVPILQFAADGDARFRKHMLQMSAFELKENIHSYNNNTILEMNSEILESALESGWILPAISIPDTFHFFVKSSELTRADYSKHLPNEPRLPYCPDVDVEVEFYLGIRCAMDAFPSVAPVLGGLPRSPCQDQCHWLRKMVKSSILSTKPLRFGNYIVTFSHICRVYEMGPEFNLIRRDIDVNNKTEQNSAERIISNSCIQGLSNIDWSAGTTYFLNLSKTAFESWWETDLLVIERMQKAYYVVKVFHLWKIWILKSKLNPKECFVTLELYRDTILMCSSMIHLALMFKLFFPEKPFMPWKWSEYPLESYYSSIRHLYGNDDEFSILEYRQRAAKIVLQQKMLIKGNITNSRNKSKNINWFHPKNPTVVTNPKLFSHQWTLDELLLKFEESDKTIQTEFKDLGMHALLEDEFLYQIQSPEDRLRNIRHHMQPDDDTTSSLLIPGDLHRGNNIPDRPATSNLSVIQRKITKSTVPKLNYKGKEMTISKYVTVVKQRGDKKASGMRNIQRFRLVDDDLTAVEDKCFLEQGDLILLKNNRLVEIIQLRRGKTFLLQAEVVDNVSFIGVYYRMVDLRIYFAEAKFTKKFYTPLKQNFKQKANILETWTEGSKKYVKIDSDILPDDNVGDDNEDSDDDDDDSNRYCFCREDTNDDFIMCSEDKCRIKWYHLRCVKLLEKNVPAGNWFCPRCQKKDHYCICGNPEHFGQMVGCSAEELCVNEWFHLGCIGLFKMPVGEFYCNECIESDRFELENTTQYCHCYRSGNFDELIKCQNRSCEIINFHKCCVSDQLDSYDDWLCEQCSLLKY